MKFLVVVLTSVVCVVLGSMDLMDFMNGNDTCGDILEGEYEQLEDCEANKCIGGELKFQECMDMPMAAWSSDCNVVVIPENASKPFPDCCRHEICAVKDNRN